MLCYNTLAYNREEIFSLYGLFNVGGDERTQSPLRDLCHQCCKLLVVSFVLFVHMIVFVALHLFHNSYRPSSPVVSAVAS